MSNTELFLMITIIVLILAIVFVNLRMDKLEKRLGNAEKACVTMLDLLSDTYHSFRDIIDCMLEDEEETVDDVIDPESNDEMEESFDLIREMLENDDEEI